ncbi:serine/threonine/tyrosine-interacting-like protein 1 [Lampetra fluviatilis]
MASLALMEPTRLYNLLNQKSPQRACLSDAHHILLVDARTPSAYEESHIITARHAQKDPRGVFTLLYENELECKEWCVVYDNKSQHLDEEGPGVTCARILEQSRKNVVYVLSGGYERFTALYPFLRSQKIIYTPQELDSLFVYPVELIAGCLYLGDACQASCARVKKALKLQAYVAITEQQGLICDTSDAALLSIPVAEDQDADLFSHFHNICQFIDEALELKRPALVFSQSAISRGCTVAIAYLMHRFKWDLQKSWGHLLQCQRKVRPHRGFVEQLSRWELSLHGRGITNISDPNY